MVPAPPEAISGTMADGADFAQLLKIVAVTHAILIHHVRHDLAGATFLDFRTQSSVFTASRACGSHRRCTGLT